MMKKRIFDGSVFNTLNCKTNKFSFSAVAVLKVPVRKFQRKQK
jgi:hypothetical protein